MQDARLSFRAGAPIAEALALCAKRAGCSLSEYLRSIVRDHVGLADPAPAIDIAAKPAQPQGIDHPPPSATIRHIYRGLPTY